MIPKVLQALTEILPPLSERERLIALAIYRLLAQGRPAGLERIAGETALPPEEVEKVVSAWPAVFRNDQGEIVGFWGLTVRPFPHQMTINGITVWAWCAWDTLFITELLGETVRVRSHSPLSKKPISFEAGPAGIWPRQSEDIHVSFLLPNGEDWLPDVVTTFCHHVHFFASRAEGEEWAASHPELIMTDLETAYAIGRQKNEFQFGSHRR